VPDEKCNSEDSMISRSLRSLKSAVCVRSQFEYLSCAWARQFCTASERETLPFDVCIVGAGPAGLSAAIRLKQLAKEENREVSVAVLEKGSDIGELSADRLFFHTALGPRRMNKQSHQLALIPFCLSFSTVLRWALRCSSCWLIRTTCSQRELGKALFTGSQILSGNILDPKALNELFPRADPDDDDFAWKTLGAPVKTRARKDKFSILSQYSRWWCPVPSSMRNRGNYIISLGYVGTIFVTNCCPCFLLDLPAHSDQKHLCYL
jgi:hypothetical protein